MPKTPGPHYFIRHGQTDWNAEGRFQGQRDIPLNETGRHQAMENGRKLLNAEKQALGSFDFISSPLGRTQQTMTLLRDAAGLPAAEFATDGAVMELCFGDWEGHTVEELLQAYPQQMHEREADKWHYMPPGESAESYETLSWRIAAWLERLSKPTVCVTHGGVIRTIFKLTGVLTAEEAARKNVPQDRILKFQSGALSWI